MERLTHSDELELLAENREETIRKLGSLGLYDASMDFYPTPEHPEDDRWPHGGIFRGQE